MSANRSESLAMHNPFSSPAAASDPAEIIEPPVKKNCHLPRNSKFRARHLLPTTKLGSVIIVTLCIMVVRGVILQVIRRMTAINESNIKILSAIEFKRQLQEDYFLPRDDGFATFFRPLLETPIVAARSKSGGKMSDEEVLAEVRRIDYSPVTLLSGPHVECITYEGTLKLAEPTLHSVQEFTNRVIDIWVLREKTYTEKAWRTYALAQDKTVEPNVARYYQLRFDDSGMLVVRTRGATCYDCHASGPLAMRVIRADLISGH